MADELVVVVLLSLGPSVVLFLYMSSFLDYLQVVFQLLATLAAAYIGESIEGRLAFKHTKES